MSASRRSLYAVLLVSAGLRVAAVFLDPPLHPDEYFQYLEPAWWQLHGVGLAAWEWNVGLRSWVLPAYNGTWMALLGLAGIESGPTIGWALKLHWAVLNTSICWLAWRAAGSLGRQLATAARGGPADEAAESASVAGGLLGAAFCGMYAILVGYSAHTLSEMPSMLSLLAGLMIVTELAEDRPHAWSRPALAGLLLSMGACLRIANGPLVIVPVFWLLMRRDIRSLAALVLGALVPVGLFALSDRLTWGQWASSYVEYIKFNFIAGGAANFGTEPWRWYVDTLRSRAPVGLTMLGIVSLLGLRATWPYVASATLLVTYLSTQPHKEERFIIGFWPLLLIATAGVLGAFIGSGRRSSTEAPQSGGAFPMFSDRRLRVAIAVVVATFVLVEGATQFIGTGSWLTQDRMTGQSWVGKQPDVTGLLIDAPLYSGGALWFGNQAPMLPFDAHLANNPLFNYAVLPSESNEERIATAAGFAAALRLETFVVLRRSHR